MDNAIDVLKQRGLFDNMTSEDLSRRVSAPITLYAGFDPTSPSLQVGNFVAIMALAHFQRCGHKVIALVGGATGMIGDPSGKTSERSLLGADTIERNVAGIRENLSRFLDFDSKTAPAKLVNNHDWLGSFTFVEFLRDVGRHFRMGAMLGRESVRARMQSEGGMSFTEFSYQLLQAYDFLHLYDTEGCTLQIGGSDQWGNITAGIDLIRKLRSEEAYGLTLPLVCDSTGQKFGKSEGNAVYLDRRMTSCYRFYQFFVRTADADVGRFLKVLTFLPLEEIAALEHEVAEAPEKRTAQKRLAEEITRVVHGKEGLNAALRASEVLFGGTFEGLSGTDLLEVFSDVPSADLPKERVVGVTVVDLAMEAGLCKSKGDARRLIEGGGLSLNNVRAPGIDTVVRETDLVDGKVAVLRSGKRNFHLVKIRS